MARKKSRIVIDSIAGGWSETQYGGAKETYNSSVAIDPDFPVGTDVKTSGMICPVVYEKFSGSNVDSYPYWFITNLKNEYVYTYLSDGKFIRYSNSLGSETLIGTPTNGGGGGAAYYNNYIYLATSTDVSRYGPLNGTPTLSNNVWTGGTLGSQTGLTNTTYPYLRQTPIPNHPMHLHVDDFLYFGDVSNGKGIINKIKTSKVAFEGDSNDGSQYNVLDLPFGYLPVAIESYTTDLAILAIKTSSIALNQGSSMLFLWDCVSDSYYKAIPLKDPIATALLNHNGILYIWSGNAVNGVRLSHYLGGDSVKDDVYLEEGTPPFAGAVDGLGSRISWGAWGTYPSTFVGVFSYGSKKEKLTSVLHNTIKATASGSLGSATAIKYVQQDSNIKPKLIVGWGSGFTSSLSSSISASISPSASASISPSISPSLSSSISPSVSPSGSTSQSISPSVSPSGSVSQSISPSISPSGSVSQSISRSTSPSGSTSTSASPSISPSGSLSQSISSSTSPSGSVSQSISRSISPSKSSSASSSKSPSVSSSTSPSGSISQSKSPSTSPSISPSISPSA